MKFLKVFFLAGITSVFSAHAQKPQVPKIIDKVKTDVARPKLVVGIVVDQMRWDYLYRFANRYGNGGFKRLLNEGFTCENTQIPYIPTFTAPGHTCIYTGSVPAIHGIAGNDFIIQSTGKSMYCAGDTTVQTVGSNSAAGQMSPANMLSTTITDELRLATNFRSKVIGIALKDRGGILPAGHSANAAYWFDDLTGNWISSTYYMKDLPAWVSDFNKQKLAEKYIKQDWNTLYPIETYSQSTADDTKYEGKLTGEEKPVFPHLLSKMLNGSYKVIRTSPYGNDLTLDFAKATLKNEQMGRGTDTDFLTLSFSSTDYIGHNYGINAVEIEDTYLRLDKNLEDLFNTLDAQVGKNQYTVFLSADHGAAHNPNFLIDNGIPAGFWPTSRVLKDLNKALQQEFKEEEIVLSLNNYQVNFNNQLIASKQLDFEKLKKSAIRFLRAQDGVANAIDMENAALSSAPQQIRERIVNGYNYERSGAIQILLKPGFFSGYSSTGTTHGSWNPYDAHIPLVFMGWGIKHGSLNRQTSMADIAPTLAALLHIQEPNGNIGSPIEELLVK